MRGSIENTSTRPLRSVASDSRPASRLRRAAGPGFGGPGPGGRGHRRPWRRAGRGRPNVRAAVLALLTERPMHGYEMIQELEQPHRRHLAARARARSTRPCSCWRTRA